MIIREYVGGCMPLFGRILMKIMQSYIQNDDVIYGSDVDRKDVIRQLLVTIFLSRNFDINGLRSDQ